MPLIEVDEATEMSEYQFFYLFSRNRSTSGVVSRMRATVNPDPFSWVKVLLAPWVDDTWPADDRAKSGEIRWFVRKDDVITWVDADYPNAISLTFFEADLHDNKILMEKDPGYEASLDALPEFERRRLKEKDWNAKPSGKKFKREHFTTYFDDSPDLLTLLEIEKVARGWDKAATAVQKKNSRKNGPDYTAGVKIGRRREGLFPRYVILDALWEQKDPGGVETLIQTTAEQDGRDCYIYIEQEGGSSGKQDIFNFVTKVLTGFAAEGIPSTGSKELRADTFAAQCKIGNVGMVRAWWNNGYLNFLCAFPDEAVHDDPVDASSLTFNQLYIAAKKDPSELIRDLRRRTTLSQQRDLPPTQDALTASLTQLPQKQKAWWE
jgi:predicted phage terminase large subunit-like protein